MTHKNLREMINGWFVGAFEPNAFETNSCEVAVKRYRAGDFEKEHLHKIATEITVIVSGNVRMLGREWQADDIVVIDPGESTDFEALTDAVIVAVKVPGALNDKYETKAQ